MTQQEVIQGLAEALGSVWGFPGSDDVEMAAALVGSNVFRDWLAERLEATAENADVSYVEQADDILGRTIETRRLEVVR